jgi:hypothetical protein
MRNNSKEREIIGLLTLIEDVNKSIELEKNE